MQSAIEARLGIKGFSDVQSNLEKVSTSKASIDERKNQNLQQMSATVQELHDKIASKKIELAPMIKSMYTFTIRHVCDFKQLKIVACFSIKDLNSMRQQAQILGHEHDSAKRKYDGIFSTVESSLSSLVRV